MADSHIHIALFNPSESEEFQSGNSAIRVNGIIKASSGWLEKQGLSKYKGKETKELLEKELVGIGAIEFEQDDSVVEFKALQLRVDGEELTAWIGPRRSESHAEFFADISRYGLGTGSHEISWSVQDAPSVLGSVSFKIVPQIQAQSVPTVAAGFGIDSLPRGIPDNLDHEEATPGRMREIHRRLPRDKRPGRDEEEELIEHVRRRFERLRTAFPDKGWVLIPPTPPLSDKWRVVPDNAFEYWQQMRIRYQRYRRARRRAKKKPFNNQAWRDRTEERHQLRGMTSRFDEINGCCCGCFVCIRVVRLTGGQFANPPAAPAIQQAIAEANEILKRCCIRLELEGSVKNLALTNSEFSRWFNTPRIELVDSESLLRTLQRRSPRSFSSNCINVLVGSARRGSLGPHPAVSGVGIGGYVAGTTGQLTFPGTTNGSVPSHVVIESRSWDGLTLAHEMAHVFCQYDKYGSLDDVFQQPAGASRSERATGAYRDAKNWKRRMDVRIRDTQTANPRMSAEDVWMRVFIASSMEDRDRMLKVYDLMAMGSEIDCDTCESMCRCIERNYSKFCA